MSVQEVLEGKRRFWVETSHVLPLLQQLPAGCIHCAVTSPPYFRQRDYQNHEQIGLEATPQEFIAKLVEVFAEVFRVLRDDGTFWLNIGDGYASGGKGGGGAYMKERKEGAWSFRAKKRGWQKAPPGWKAKDRLGIPHRLVFALQDAGWTWRDEIVWGKVAPMTESVSDRTTKAHEFVFLLSKQPRYFYDWYAIGEPSTWQPGAISNQRSVWTLAPEFFPGQHFATFPTELPRRAILASTSSYGCCARCGAPWRRKLKKERKPTRPGVNSKCLSHSNGDTATSEAMGWNRPNVIGNRDPQRHVTITHMLGWEPSCKCGETTLVAPVVLDPFSGSGTTGLVATRLGCRFIGAELNDEYAAASRTRLASDTPLFG